MFSHRPFICSLIIFLIGTVCLHAGEIKIEFDYSVLTNNNISLSSARALFRNDDRTDTFALDVTNNKISGIFHGDYDGSYRLSVLLFEGDVLVCNGSCEAVISDEDTVLVTGRFITTCRTPKLLLNWGNKPAPKLDEVLGFKIDSSCTRFNTVNLPLFDSVVKRQRKDGLSWYIPMPVNYSILDTNYIPLVHYSFGDYRNPVTTCQTALGFSNLYKATGDSFYLAALNSNLKWLKENHDSDYYFRYDFDFSHTYSANLKKGWISALGQGEALAVFSIAYDMFGDSTYLNDARHIFRTLYSNIDSTWCILIDQEGYYWAEEYPNKDFCHVLNGNIATLWGIMLYYSISGDEFAQKIFQGGMRTLIDHYPMWNVEKRNMSYYCMHKKTFDSYHASHQRQLLYFGDQFGIPDFYSALECFTKSFADSLKLFYRANAGADSLAVKAGNDSKWTMISPAEWIAPFHSNDSLIQVNILPNPNTALRKDTLLIHTTYAIQKVVIIQQDGYGNQNNIPSDRPYLNFLLYPDPATTELNVRFNSCNDRMIFGIISSSGALMMEGTIDPATYSTIDISELPAGIYMIRCTNRKGITGAARFVKTE